MLRSFPQRDSHFISVLLDYPVSGRFLRKCVSVPLSCKSSIVSLWLPVSSSFCQCGTAEKACFMCHSPSLHHPELWMCEASPVSIRETDGQHSGQLQHQQTRKRLQNDYAVLLQEEWSYRAQKKKTNLLTRTTKVSKETSDSLYDDSVIKEHVLCLVNAITVKKNTPFERQQKKFECLLVNFEDIILMTERK